VEMTLRYNMNNWVRTNDRLPDEGVVVNTKIDDENGCRNEQPLKRCGTLWYIPSSNSMYVYYSPTHWRYADAK
jgi:hypothetical protein